MNSINFYIDSTEIFKNKNTGFGNDIEENTGKHKRITSHANIYLLQECVNNINNNNKPPTSIGTWYGDWVVFNDNNTGTNGKQLIYIPNFGRFELPIIFNTDFLSLINQKFTMISSGNQTGTYFDNTNIFGKKLLVNGEITGNVVIYRVTIE